MRVAFQGESGAYSEEAIIKHWDDQAEPVPKPYLPDVFNAVEKGEADLGLVPVENSIQGSIVRTFDLLNERTLVAQGETVLRIVHCLIVNPGVKAGDIKKVYSHPQALGQSMEYLEKHGYEPVGAYDTAGSVKNIKDDERKDAAAVASSRAAQVYDMEILEQGIETHKENYTRFLVIGRDKPRPTGSDKTSIAFVVKHEPGSLVKALSTLSERGINLMKIESRPLVGTPWEYIFFIDFEGHVKDKTISEALDELNKQTNYIKHLGSYPRAK
ncbi:MAG: prephenate dehydratase [Candidatus Bathyarchaeota archaeon]|nr:prephenate dehydratase [Candidatus Bathyarchaeota archaeon]